MWLIGNVGHQAEIPNVAVQAIGAQGDSQLPYTLGHPDVSCLRQVKKHLPPFGLPD